jgi:NADH-quinone oxidoreductase subunit N
MWIPDVYEGAPPAVTLFISSVPKLAAFAMAFRLLSSGLGDLHFQWQNMLASLAVLSIILGNLAAIMQTNIKRMLAYSTISHMGFVLLGLLPDSPFGFGSSMYYVIVYGIMSVAAFGMVILLSARGVEAENLSDFKGLNQRNPYYAAIMGLVMFSMAGIPPMVGFFAKLMVLKAVIEAGMIWLAVAAVVFAVIGAFYYLRVVKYMYFDEPENETAISAPVDFGAAVTLNGIMILGLGIFSSSLITICMTSFGS